MQPHKAERTTLRRVKLLNANDFLDFFALLVIPPAFVPIVFCQESPSFPLPAPSLISSCLSPTNLVTVSLIFTHTMKSPEPAQVVLTLYPLLVATVPCTNSYQSQKHNMPLYYLYACLPTPALSVILSGQKSHLLHLGLLMIYFSKLYRLCFATVEFSTIHHHIVIKAYLSNFF